MLHCRCKGAAPLVQGCCTSLVTLFSFDLDCVLTGQSELRMKNEELSASPIKEQRSAAGGEANYRIKKQRSTSDRKATVKTLE